MPCRLTVVAAYQWSQTMAAAPLRLDRRTLLAGASAGVAGSLVATPASARAVLPERRAPAVLRQGATVVRIAQYGSIEDAKTTKTLFDQFTATHPDVQVEVIPIEAPDWDQYFTKVLALIASGDAPDVCFCATEGLQLFASRLAAPLDDYVTRDSAAMQEYFSDVAPSLVEAMMYEGSLYSLPVDFNAANIFFSPRQFAEAGAAMPSPTWTIDDFTTSMRAIAESGKYGFAWTNRHWGGAIPWIFINGGNILTEEKAPGGEWLWQSFYASDPAAQGRGGGIRWANSQANAAANVEALQYLVDLTYELNAAPNPAQAEGDQSQVIALFSGGQLSSFPAGSYLISSLASSGVTPENFDVTFMPKWKSQRHQFGTGGYVILNDSLVKDAAWELLKFRASSDVIASVAAGGNTTPARRSLATDALWTPELGPKSYSVFYDTLDKFPDAAPIPAPPPAVEMANIFTRYVGLAMSQDQTAQESLDGMHQELTDLLARQA